MKYLLLTAFVFCLVSCQNKSNNFEKERYEQNKKRLADNEQNQPLDFLKIEGDHHKNIFGKTVVKALVTNYAAVCSYKDIRIKMLSYDASGKMIEEHEDEMSDVIKPRASADFKTKYKLPKTVDSIAISIMSATPVLDSLKK